jgi:hypothetical protein
VAQAELPALQYLNVLSTTRILPYQGGCFAGDDKGFKPLGIVSGNRKAETKELVCRAMQLTYGRQAGSDGATRVSRNHSGLPVIREQLEKDTEVYVYL